MTVRWLEGSRVGGSGVLGKPTWAGPMGIEKLPPPSCKQSNQSILNIGLAASVCMESTLNIAWGRTHGVCLLGLQRKPPVLLPLKVMEGVTHFFDGQ